MTDNDTALVVDAMHKLAEGMERVSDSLNNLSDRVEALERESRRNRPQPQGFKAA